MKWNAWTEDYYSMSINFMNKILFYDTLFCKCQTLIKYVAHLANYENEQSPVDNLTLIIGNVDFVNNLEYAWGNSLKYVMWAIKYVKSRANIYSLVSKTWQA